MSETDNLLYHSQILHNWRARKHTHTRTHARTERERERKREREYMAKILWFLAEISLCKIEIHQAIRKTETHEDLPRVCLFD